MFVGNEGWGGERETYQQATFGHLWSWKQDVCVFELNGEGQAGNQVVEKK